MLYKEKNVVYGKKKMQIVPPNKQYEGYIVWYVMYHIIYKKKILYNIKKVYNM